MTIYDKFSRYYDVMYSQYDHKAECDYLQVVFQNFRREPPTRILDLGCGTGSHALILAEKGYNVTGIDLSNSQIQLAREKASNIENSANLEFFVSDMRNFTIDQKFDAAISLFGSICYVTDDSDIRSVFSRVHNHLNVNGLFIFEFWNVGGVLPSASEGGHTSWLKAESEDYRIIRTNKSTYDPNSCTLKLEFEVLVISGSNVIDEFNETHRLRIFSPGEIMFLLKRNGFKVIGIFEHQTLEPAKHNSFRQMAIAKKIDI